MAKRYSLLVTEGPHDQAAIGKLLRLLGLNQFNGRHANLESFWKSLVPEYPRKDDLYKPLNMPYIYTSQDHSVAIYHSEGKDNIPIDLVAICAAYGQVFHAIGVVIDADQKQPNQVVQECVSKLRDEVKDSGIDFPMFSEVAGAITSGTPRTGMYIMPDNSKQGTLDCMLVECAASIYPNYRIGAEQFLDGLLKSVNDSFTERLGMPFVKEKAIVASIVSVLKPGLSNTSSIARDKWVCEQTVKDVTEVAMLKQFIENLLELTINEPGVASQVVL